MKKVRVGILGCAKIADRYAIPAFKTVDEVELVAIASRNEDKAREWAQKYGLEAESYESLIARQDVEIIYSPLPIGLQEEWALRVAAVGKHMICEKSITFSLGSAKKMVEAFKKKGLAIYENFVPEFHPQHEKILSLIAKGAIGKPQTWSGAFGFPPFPEGDIRFNKELKGGALNDCGCYTVFMARKIMQAEPVAVTCALSNDAADVDIRGSALLEFPDTTALMAFGFDNVYQSTYSVWGSKGILRTSPAFTMPPSKIPKIELVTNDGKQEIVEVIQAEAVDQFALSFKYFCSAVAANDKNKIDDMYERIIRQAAVMEAMRTSAREGKRVDL